MEKSPRYLDLAARLRRALADGAYAVGDNLPTEHQLCSTYSVSRHTARAALQMLEADGLIERRPGRGTRVVATGGAGSFIQPLGGLDALLQYAFDARLAIVSHAIVSLTPALARRLGAPAGDAWLRLEGVRYAGDEAVAATTIHIAGEIGATASDFTSTETPITRVIEDRYGVATASVDQTIRAEIISKADAVRLAAPAESAILRTLRRYADRKGRIYVISDSRHPGGRFAYAMTYRRTPSDPQRTE